MAEKTKWSDEHYKAVEKARKAKGEKVFKHEEELKAKPVEERRVHPKMDPYQVIRESRDSRVHPSSRAVIVAFDHTGSMKRFPEIAQASLPKLMGAFNDTGIEPNAQVLICAFGDATSDDRSLSDGTSSRGSMQVGQFEIGIEIDEDLKRVWRIGGGGPFGRESYQNVLYFADRHTSIDCYEKRGEKGFLFIFGDEAPYMRVRRDEAAQLFGDTLQDDVPIDEVIKSLTEKYHIFFVIPNSADGFYRTDIRELWVSLLGPQNVLSLERDEEICNLITNTVGGILGTLPPEENKEEDEKEGVVRL